MSARPMTCHVCGDYAGRYEQYEGMGKGKSLCEVCAGSVAEILTARKMQDLYGIEGVNYARGERRVA